MVAGALKLATHEMWRDELQAWMIAREAASLADLLGNLRYEGHPFLWHLLLFGLSRLGRDPRIMQVLHLGIATATAAVALWRAPLPVWQRRLFVFGYFPFFEYLNISRGYGLTLLLALLASVAGWRRERSWPATGVALGLLALTSVYGTILSLSLAGSLAYDQWRTMRTGADSRPSWTALAVGATFAVGGWAAAALQMLPPADSGLGQGWFLRWSPERLQHALGGVWRGLVPIPPVDARFWDRDLLSESTGSALAAALLGSILLVLVAYRLLEHRPALLLWAGGAIALLAFSYTRFPGSVRHAGHLFVLLVLAAWAHSSRAGALQPPAQPRRPPAVRPVLAGVLVLQAAAGTAASMADLVLPFSMSRRTAEYVREHGREAMLVGESDYAASAVSAWLDRPVFSPQARRYSTFVVWDEARSCGGSGVRSCIGRRELVEATRRVLDDESGPDSALLLSSAALDDDGARHLASFTGGIVADEDFHVYKVVRGVATQAAAEAPQHDGQDRL